MYCYLNGKVGPDTVSKIVAERKILEMLEISTNPFNLLYLQLNIITHDVNTSLSCKYMIIVSQYICHVLYRQMCISKFMHSDSSDWPSNSTDSFS